MSVFLVLRMKKRLLRSELRVVPPIGMYLVASAMKGCPCLSPYFGGKGMEMKVVKRERERKNM